MVREQNHRIPKRNTQDRRVQKPFNRHLPSIVHETDLPCPGNAVYRTIVIAGCTSPPAPSSTPKTVLPTATPTPGLDFVPRPTGVVPPLRQVAVQVTRHTIAPNPWIPVLFAEGIGQPDVGQPCPQRSSIQMAGSRPKTALSPGIKTNLMFTGTTRTDRAIVNVT